MLWLSCSKRGSFSSPIYKKKLIVFISKASSAWERNSPPSPSTSPWQHGSFNSFFLKTYSGCTQTKEFHSLPLPCMVALQQLKQLQPPPPTLFFFQCACFQSKRVLGASSVTLSSSSPCSYKGSYDSPFFLCCCFQSM